MNIIVTEFVTPFSFFCRINDGTLDMEVLKEIDCVQNFKNVVSNVTHGQFALISAPQHSYFNLNMFHDQYVAVFWKNRWNRGIVSMESEYMIWLVDYGFHLRTTNRTVVIDLIAEYKKYPTKVFEASIHSVVPVAKTLSDDYQMTNTATFTWNQGAIEKAQTLIQAASKTYFVPMAIISTKQNDVVIGDLYFNIPGKGLCNLANELEMWPSMFLEKNCESYIKNLALHYTTRRKHRACPLKPNIPHLELPIISLESTFPEYRAICEKFEQSHPLVNDSSDSDDVSTMINIHRGQKNKEVFKLTAQEIEKYANMHVKIFDQVYNALHLLLNKIKDLNICEKYKDYDLKSVGRGYARNRKTDTLDEL